MNKITQLNNEFSELLCHIHDSGYLDIANLNGFFKKEYSYNQSTDQIRTLIATMHGDFIVAVSLENWKTIKIWIQSEFIRICPSKILTTVYVIKPSVFKNLSIEKFTTYMLLTRNDAGFYHIYYNYNLSFIIYYNEF